jgi:hypothetical protein
MTDYQNKKGVASVAEEGSAYYQEQASEKRKYHLGKLGGQMRIILKRMFTNQSVRCGLHRLTHDRVQL